MTAPALRVAVTRDEDPDGDLSRALRACGLVPAACPAIERREPADPGPLRAAAGSLERFDWLVAASAHAVAALLAARGNRPLPPALRTAAVGERTAARLREAGSPAPVTAHTAGAEALAARLEQHGPWNGRRCLIPRALDGGALLGESLRGRGAEVEEVVAYRTEPRPAAAIAEVWREAAADAVVVASPSAANALVDAIGPEPLRRLRAVVAIGATTREALLERGVPSLVPDRADFDSVARLLRDFSFQESEVSP